MEVEVGLDTEIDIDLVKESAGEDHGGGQAPALVTRVIDAQAPEETAGLESGSVRLAVVVLDGGLEEE